MSYYDGTHEKTFQILKRLAILVVAMLLAYMFASCGHWSPTQAEPETNNEQLAAQLSACHYRYMRLEEKYHKPLTVAFEDEERSAPCPPGENGPCIGAAWATPGSPKVTFYRGWLNQPARSKSEIDVTAAHEVCHVSGIMIDNPSPNHPEWETAPACGERISREDFCGS